MTKQQHEADLHNPEERFAWAFQGIEVNGTPTAIPEPIRKEWSKHFSRAGFVHISEVLEALEPYEGDFWDAVSQLPQQEIQYQPPIRGQQHSMNTSGQWVGMDQEIKQPVVPTVSLMTPQERAQMISELKEEGYID